MTPDRPQTSKKTKIAEAKVILLARHPLEVMLTFVALICAIVFFVLHVILGTANEIWWLLALSTILLALSDVIMRVRGKRG